MAKEKIDVRQIGPLRMRASFDPKTVNKETRTVDVCFATDTPIRMSGWDGAFMEILSMKEGAVRMDRLNAGAPLLDNHNRYEGVTAVMGVVERAWTKGGKGYATVRFSKREDVEPVWQDVQDGILTGISAGYRVYEYSTKEREGQLPEFTATDWEPFEISLAPVQADLGATVRGAENTAANDVTLKPVTADTQPQPTRSMEPEKKPEAETKPAAADVEAARKAGAEGERTRVLEIRKAGKAAKMSDEFVEKLVSDGTSVDESRKLIIEKFADADPAKGAAGAQPTKVGEGARAGEDETDKRRTGMTEALEHRSFPTKETTEKVKGNEFRGMSLIRMAGEAIVAAGGKIRGMTDQEIARYALNMTDRSGAGMLSTSDFPIILGNTVNRRLLAEYAVAERTFTAWASRESAKDFKSMTRARMGDISSFSKVGEGSNYKYGKMDESKEAYVVEKYGEIIGITWETLVNDDLGAFNRMPKKIANAAARKQSDIVYAILSANAAMSDTVALFHATHGNLGTGAAISIDSLGEGRKLLRLQKGLGSTGNVDYLNLVAKFLVVGPAYEALALQYTSSAYVPNTQSQINPFKDLVVIVEPRITGNVWYLMASPSAIDNVEYAFLEGDGELFTEQRQSFDMDGLEIKARMVFGAKAIDWKGMVKNPGA